METETTKRAPRAQDATCDGERPLESKEKRVISLGRVSALGLACLPLLLFALFFARFAAGERVLSGVVLAGVPLGGMSREAAQQRLAARGQALNAQKLQLVLGGKSAVATAEQLGLELVAHDSASRAIEVGR